MVWSKMSAPALGVLTVALFATTAFASDPAKLVDTARGKVFADAKGMTLYFFDKDRKGVSNCYGKCARSWPPLKASASDKAVDKWTIVKRSDGSLQWAYDGKPVYLWVRDKKPGDITGDGVGKVWRLARP